MRYIRVRLEPGEEGLHPIERILAGAPEVRREAIQQVNLVTEETAAVLYELERRGDVSDLVARLEDHEDMLALDVTETGGRLFAYAHFRTNDTVGELLRAENELVFETPIEYTDGGALRLTVIGETGVLQGLDPDIPDSVEVAVEGIGDYDPAAGRLWSQLTRRQQQTLRVAVDAGYYRSPRGATYDDLAAELDISPGTVGEHLQKVERAILPEVVPNED